MFWCEMWRRTSTSRMKAILARAFEEQIRSSMTLIAVRGVEVNDGHGLADHTEENAPSPSLRSSRQVILSPWISSSVDGVKKSPARTEVSSAPTS